jgi:hypothetical protein
VLQITKICCLNKISKPLWFDRLTTNGFGLTIHGLLWVDSPPAALIIDASHTLLITVKSIYTYNNFKAEIWLIKYWLSKMI